ncbi:MAG: AAA family ATPase [Helicobacteraceae bacterium]|jgi:DNA repair protein RecN (Recombination protein N)|nr:AAA family ATPase [Helicobacteraceae bacterium]
MITRISIKNVITFGAVQLSPCAGLNVFSGPSGAGKSVLMSAILAVFGLKDSDAASVEAVLGNVLLNEELPVEIAEDEEIILRAIKKEKTRYFINDFQIGKSALKTAFDGIARHLNQKESSDLDSKNLLNLLDLIAKQTEITQKFRADFADFEAKNAKLNELKAKEKNAQELKESAQFEIAKIEEIAPKEGEYERLMERKKRLSRKEKIKDAMARAATLKDNESAVFALYDLIGLDTTQFTEAMNELAAALENAQEGLEDDADPDALLNRIEQLASLNRRYGGANEALARLAEKKKELADFESIEADIKKLEREIDADRAALENRAEAIAKAREKAAKPLTDTIAKYLAQLFMPKAAITVEKKPLNAFGGSAAAIALNGAELAKISSGEFNRLRLALLAARVEIAGDQNERAILFLDEIDANVSGEEAAAIAATLKMLASRYQIFAISHHSQLTSKADAHYLVYKEGAESCVKLLDRAGRINEIARIISADKITNSAIKHAEALLGA